ncbi:AMP-binding protein [Tomitella gaofuii]|uniref:AMP-binding protein n=1 Tax=Tomitella gaofuii TaxID=2760083 RepID=UPI0015FB7310|nr:AMP-binding protein [Tomitella gaofuii]
MPNVIDPVRRHAADSPDKTAVREGGTDWSYGRLYAAAVAYGAALRRDGITTGDRVLLAAPTTPEFIVAYLGIQAVGAIAVPVNTMSTAAEVEYYLSDSGATLAVGWHGLGPAVADGAGTAGVPCRALPSMDPAAAQTATSTDIDVADREADDTCAILYTSGTTGRPKGAQITVDNLLAAGEIGAHGARGGADDRTGTGLPLFHVFGQASVMMATFCGGGMLSLLPRFDPVAMIEMLRRDKLTIMCGVPTMWNAMLHAASDASPADFASLRVAVSGGASLPGEVARAFETKFGCTLLEGYGLTETAAIATFNDIDKGGKIGSVGAPMTRMAVEIRDPIEGHPCQRGEVGEVFVQGPTVTTGYWNRPEATKAALVDGWFRTGDLGVLDDDGDLRIVDRLKDLIIRGGYNVYPGEVEEVLYAHPDVVEAAVVGVPDDHYGEEVAALIVVRPGSGADADADADAIDAWCRERLSAYKVPRLIRFTDALPKGATGKILKRAIDRAGLRGASA